MKIVAHVPTGGYHRQNFLVEMTTYELALIAFANVHDPRANKLSEQRPGTELKIDERYRRLYKLEANRDQLDKAIQQLKACATILEPLLPIVSCDEPINGQHELKEGECQS